PGPTPAGRPRWREPCAAATRRPARRWPAPASGRRRPSRWRDDVGGGEEDAPMRVTTDEGGLVALATGRMDVGAVRAGAPAARILRAGPGPRPARAAAGRARALEGAAVAAAGLARPLAVVRAIVDGDPRTRPGASARAWRTLARAGTVLAEWAAAVRPRRVVLGAPRASCAGVERAIEIVERALERHGPPLYVRKQIVHNTHVVADLERRGVVFVDEVDEV